MSNSMQALWDSSVFTGANAAYLEQQYESYLLDPNSVDELWRKTFAALPDNGNSKEFFHSEIREKMLQLALNSKNNANLSNNANSNIDLQHEREQTMIHDLVNGYRLLGHLQSNIDPLGLREKIDVPELSLNYYKLNNCNKDAVYDAAGLPGSRTKKISEVVSALQRIYCGDIGSEFMHISNYDERHWIQEKVEHKFDALKFNKSQQTHILERLTAAEGLEKYLAAKYPGAKRFGLEGCDSLIVALDALISEGSKLGMAETVIGMAHRGRLNVLVNIFGKLPSELFDEFEGKHYSKEIESGDVKYHQGFSSDLTINNDKKMHLSLAFNPSHLEIVTPVMCGSVRARQERRNIKGHDGKSEVMAIAIHGDAAFSGQGVVMETMNMSLTRGYSIGGTIHIIINNQIGFTTSNPADLRSTLYCSDIGKMLHIPVFHVNADNPEAVYAVCEIASEYRRKFEKDIIIDLYGYRRHGHNEADEPMATQPNMYKIIKNRPTVRTIYADNLAAKYEFSKDLIEDLVKNYRKSLDSREQAVVKNLVRDGWKSIYATDWTDYNVKDWRSPIKTGIDLNVLKELACKRDTVPEGFMLHSRVKKIIADREKMTSGEILADWGYAETLAYASLLAEGYGVRLAGQDCGRGTFFHRHVVWHDQSSKDTYISLCHLKDQQGNFWVINSLLSEMAVLGFEYGYSTSEPRALVIWEAQFGDFANSAQVVIDQFISSGEQKWGRLSGLVMLLPHGYEGQGPEHSSARLERYLQLCAQHNIQVCVPSTPAQVFHMLRRQILRPMRKPLCVMSPKSLLRHKLAVSKLEEFTIGCFMAVIADNLADPKNVDRVILCSGKIYYELYELREAKNLQNIALIRIEQLYPFPETELQEELARYNSTKLVIWCQEEPKNQGAWYSTQHHIKICLQHQQNLGYAGREASAAPAAGYAHLHKAQQQKLLLEALGLDSLEENDL